ncbi:hypothetical protein M407DRAFT_177647 [Tulasnella calospora MUT 4182]|uniref:Uncharacterized protein n=1 Tax=Tulasnella calospora MUT 4182 TaxID=1051891 RepID=A0A0C3MJA3_9AGAM|nr:hypothetical protein M407DRAFT_177647 [Tulasnella calospora MUT 4182]
MPHLSSSNPHIHLPRLAIYTRRVLSLTSFRYSTSPRDLHYHPVIRFYFQTLSPSYPHLILPPSSGMERHPNSSVFCGLKSPFFFLFT